MDGKKRKMLLKAVKNDVNSKYVYNLYALTKRSIKFFHIALLIEFLFFLVMIPFIILEIGSNKFFIYLVRELAITISMVLSFLTAKFINDFNCEMDMYSIIVIVSIEGQRSVYEYMFPRDKYKIEKSVFFEKYSETIVQCGSTIYNTGSNIYKSTSVFIINTELDVFDHRYLRKINSFLSEELIYEFDCESFRIYEIDMYDSNSEPFDTIIFSNDEIY